MENTNLQKKGIASYWLVILFVIISFAIVFICKGGLMFLQAPISNPTFEKVANTWESRVVKIMCEGEQSTGFIMESKVEENENYLYIVSSAHGVDQNPNNAKFIINGSEISGENLSVNSNIDVAVFKVKGEGDYQLPNLSSVSLAKQVMALGYPQNESLTSKLGYINKTSYVDENSSLSSLLCYDIDAYIKGGMSGCPVLDINGALVGIGLRTKETTQGIIYTSENYLTPASILFAEYDRATEHNSKPMANYLVSIDNGAIVLTVDNKQVTEQNGAVMIDNKKVITVANKTINSIVDFAANISYYSNRNALGQVSVITDEGGILVKVINE